MDLKSTETHDLILGAISQGLETPVAIREYAARKLARSADDISNVVAWGLVELQNKDLNRTHGATQDGLIIRVGNTYRLRT